MSAKARKRLFIAIPAVVVIFFAITGLYMNDDPRWLGNQLASPRLAMQIALLLWGSILLYLIGWGATAVFRIAFRRFAVSIAGRILLLLLFLGITAINAFAMPGTYSREILGAVFTSFLEAASIFWLLRRCKFAYIRVVRGDEGFEITNAQIVIIHIASLIPFVIPFGLPLWLDFSAIFPLMMAALFALPLRLLIRGVYFAFRSSTRHAKYGKTPLAYEGEDFVFYGRMRTFRLPLSSISAVEKLPLRPGVAVMLALYPSPRWHEVLSIGSSARTIPLVIPYPGDEAVHELARRVRETNAIVACDEAGEGA